MNYYKGVIQNKKFKLRNRAAFDSAITHYPSGEYLVCLFKIHKKTNKEWRALYFAILGNWSLDTGYTKDELHAMIKDELFPELFEDGEQSTSELNNDQWNALFLNIENFLILKFENK